MLTYHGLVNVSGDLCMRGCRSGHTTEDAGDPCFPFRPSLLVLPVWHHVVAICISGMNKSSIVAAKSKRCFWQVLHTPLAFRQFACAMPVLPNTWDNTLVAVFEQGQAENVCSAHLGFHARCADGITINVAISAARREQSGSGAGALGFAINVVVFSCEMGM